MIAANGKAMWGMAAKGKLQDELDALRRELQAVPLVGDDTQSAEKAGPQSADTRTEIERVLGELQDRLGEGADEAEEIIKANPFASVAAAFLLGVLVANLMSRGK
jgi:ElaB/YqjD/DUF883 family membrane-anchored ribosome-binding protein